MINRNPLSGGNETSGMGISGGSPGGNLRDSFAMSALQGLAAKGLEVNADRAMTQEDKHNAMAEMAYGLADAMMRARVKQNAPA